MLQRWLTRSTVRASTLPLIPSTEEVFYLQLSIAHLNKERLHGTWMEQSFLLAHSQRRKTNGTNQIPADT